VTLTTLTLILKSKPVIFLHVSRGTFKTMLSLWLFWFSI